MKGGFPQFTPQQMALFEAHCAWADQIATNVHRRMPPSFDRDDIRQRAWLGLAEAVAKYEAGKGVPFGAFAFRYVAGGAWMAVRRREYTERTHAELPQNLDVAAPAADPEDERWEMVRAAMERLTPRQRIDIVDHWFLCRPVPAKRLDAAMAALRAEVSDVAA